MSQDEWKTGAFNVSSCKHEWHEEMKKNFALSACKHMTRHELLCNYFSLIFSECSGLQQRSYQMYKCKSVISCCCDIFPSRLLFFPPVNYKTVVDEFSGWQISGNTVPLFVRYNLTLCKWRSHVCVIVCFCPCSQQFTCARVSISVIFFLPLSF